jgi:branched-subunit amino acid ABC-type transport system permease component
VNRPYISAFALLVLAALALLLWRTTLGLLQVRAVSQNRPMARAMRCAPHLRPEGGAGGGGGRPV